MLRVCVCTCRRVWVWCEHTWALTCPVQGTWGWAVMEVGGGGDGANSRQFRTV